MGSLDRSNKRIQLWKKALIHFAICFVMGFFTGFAPTSTASLFSARHVVSYQPLNGNNNVNSNLMIEEDFESTDEPAVWNRNLMAEFPVQTPSNMTTGPVIDTTLSPPAMEARQQLQEDDDGDVEAERLSSSKPQRLLIIITTTRSDDRFQSALLRRLARTLRLVPSPLLWIIVQARNDAAMTAEMLRGTGVMYRHLTFRENFTDPAAEAEHQRNVALSHIEYHRLTGIVHFAATSNVYDLQFFEEIRQIEVFGAWPVAMVSSNRKRVLVDGPVCHSSKVVGWFLKDLSNYSYSVSNLNDADISLKPPKINISGFAFNSSILWDPERWGRPTSLPDTSQDSFKFVQEVILEDETKLKGIPANCSRIMLWNLYISRVIPLPFHQSQNGNQR